MRLAFRVRPSVRALNRLVVAAAVCGATLGKARSAAACGASASSGGVAVCSLEDVRKEERKRWHVAASYAFTDTRIRFFGDSLAARTKYDQVRHLVMASAAYRPKRWWSLELGAGALVSGSLSFRQGESVVDRQKKTLAPGPALGLSSSFVLSQGKKWVPFALVTVQLSALFSNTGDNQPYFASDLRLGGALGWKIGSVFLPYALGRVFGGPISWKIDGATVQGTDDFHYQVGLGVSVILPKRIDLYLEGVPLGERGFSAGLGWTF